MCCWKNSNLPNLKGHPPDFKPRSFCSKKLFETQLENINPRTKREPINWDNQNQELYCQMASQRSVPCVHSPPGRWPAEIHSGFFWMAIVPWGKHRQLLSGCRQATCRHGNAISKELPTDPTDTKSWVCRGVRDFTIIHMWYASICWICWIPTPYKAM